MADTATSNGEGKSECRDFARGVCNRGSSCRFYHPPNAASLSKEAKLPICKDFQNKGCDRHKCKFLHITQEEEEEYNMSGILPEHGGRPERVRALGIPGGRGAAGGGGSYQSQGVACKDFLNGICQRGSKCKFRHITEQQHQAEIAGGPMYGKRRRNDYGGPGLGDYMPYLEENELLRRKIADLQRQVVDLRQMNDTLYEQNNKYRAQLRMSQTASTDPYSAYSTTATASADPLQGYAGYSKF